MQTLLIFSHTFWEESKVNKVLLESAKTLSNVTLHNLNTTYPDGCINKESEIALLSANERIIFQFPLFWFSTPALMKDWQDKVLHDVLRESPNLLKGKRFCAITTAGGDKKSYDGHHGYNLDTLLSPLYHTFSYLGCVIEETLCLYSANVNNIPLQEYLEKLRNPSKEKAK